MDFKFPTLWDYEMLPKKDSFLTKEEKQQIIENCINDIGFGKFEKELMSVILPRIDYEGFIREIFKVSQTSSSNFVFTIDTEEEDEFSKTREALQEVRDLIDNRS